MRAILGLFGSKKLNFDIFKPFSAIFVALLQNYPVEAIKSYEKVIQIYGTLLSELYPSLEDEGSEYREFKAWVGIT